MEVATPEITKLVEAGNDAVAFPLLRRALQIVPKDPVLNKILNRITHLATIKTNPPGATIYLKPYEKPEAEWLLIGQSPVERFLLPMGYFRWRVMKPGYRTVESAAGFRNSTIEFTLKPEDAGPVDMVYVPAGAVRTAGQDVVRLKDYFIDKYEVTNKQFKQFVNLGGYDKRQYWTEEFVKDGHALTWEQAMAEFRDASGRPGPATWEIGGYAPGQDEYPVNGVSWYEAAAYAKFAGKQLPTVYHWYRAADQDIYADILMFSNFSGTGPLRVGSRSGLGPFGTYDMAGNVKEWCLNPIGSRRYALGGSWLDTRSQYVGPDALSPFDRSPANGFRCVRYPEAALPDALTRTVDLGLHERFYKPVSGEVFRAFQSFYTYDRTELNSVIESKDDSSPYWRAERITFNAAYSGQRVIAWLYLPKSAKPPYQTVIFHPPGSSRVLPKIDEAEIRPFDFLVENGRAVLFPIYQGTYERRTAPRGPSGVRDRVIQECQDLQRSVDYLETRKDVASDRIGFLGISDGARVGLIALAEEPRIRTAILAEGGISLQSKRPEIDEVNFAPRVRIPVLMLNGRDDFIYPAETSVIPLFRLLGSPAKDKRRVEFPTGHHGDQRSYAKETLDWFDRYLGPVNR